jgi:hypothetical protein
MIALACATQARSGLSEARGFRIPRVATLTVSRDLPVVANRFRNRAITRSAVVVLTRTPIPTVLAMPTSSTVNPEVIAAQQVPMDAMRLPRLARSRRFATQQIDSLSDGLHVPWIAAGSIPAEVINLQSVRDRTDQHLIARAMRLREPSLPLRMAIAGITMPVAGIRPALVTTTDHSDDIVGKHRLTARRHIRIYSRLPLGVRA